MATLTIRQLDEKTKSRLRIRAAHHGRSMEEEVRLLLAEGAAEAAPAKPTTGPKPAKRSEPALTKAAE